MPQPHRGRAEPQAHGRAVRVTTYQVWYINSRGHKVIDMSFPTLAQAQAYRDQCNARVGHRTPHHLTAVPHAPEAP